MCLYRVEQERVADVTSYQYTREIKGDPELNLAEPQIVGARDVPFH